MLVFMVVSMLSHVRELLARRSRGCEDEAELEELHWKTKRESRTMLR